MEGVNTKSTEAVPKSKETETVKGTIFSVGVVGAVILLTYVIVYGLYMMRV